MGTGLTAGLEFAPLLGLVGVVLAPLAGLFAGLAVRPGVGLRVALEFIEKPGNRSCQSSSTIRIARSINRLKMAKRRKDEASFFKLWVPHHKVNGNSKTHSSDYIMAAYW